MSVRVFPAQASQRAALAQKDEVVAAFPLPGGTVVNKVWLRMSVIASSISFIQAALYGVDGYIIPQLDPDTGVTPDDMWDAQIPKDDAVGSDVIDLDTVTDDNDPVFEPGEPSLSDIMDLTTAPVKIFKRRRMLTFGDRAAGFEAATPDTFIPAETWRSTLRRKYRVEVPSWLLIGISSPGTLQTANTFDTVAAEKSWAMLKYFEHTLEMMMIQLVGLTEAGAESPYEDAANEVSKFLQQFVEFEAGSFAPVTWTAFTEATCDLTLTGSLRSKAISAGGVT